MTLGSKNDPTLGFIHLTEIQLNRANSSDTEASFFALNLCISNGTVSAKIYDKWDDFDLIRSARASSNLSDFNYRYKALTAKLLRQGYRYFKLRKVFSKLYRRHSALVEKYSVSLKIHLEKKCRKIYLFGATQKTY